MARLSYLGCVNAVLKKLGNAEVSSVSETTYSSLIGGLVNEARRRVEMSIGLRWHDLRSEIDITTAIGESTYSITGYGCDYVIQRITNESESRAKIDLISQDNWIDRTSTSQTGKPCISRLKQFDSNGDPRLELFPVPSSVQTVRVWGWRGQGIITNDSQELLVPDDPVVLCAYMLAIEERGDDGGDPRVITRYQDAMTEAIARESDMSGYPRMTDFVVD